MISRIYEPVAGIVTRRPGVVISVFIACIVVALIGASTVTMTTGTDTYVDKSTPRGMVLDSYTETFQSDSLMLMVESDNVLTPDMIAYIDRLQKEIGSQRYITSTISLADMARAANNGALPSSQAEIQGALARVPPSTFNRFVPSQLMTIIQVRLEPGLTQTTKNGITNNINSIAKISQPPPGATLTVTGDPVFQQEMASEMSQSMGILILIAMVFMIIAVGLLFSHMRYRLLSVAIVGCGLIFTFGTVGFARIPISMVTISAFPVLIGVGIDYAIQFHSRFDEEVRNHPLPEAAARTIIRSGPSILYAMLATSMGFLAMYISPVPMIRDFGIVCVIGVFCCYLAALIGVPAFGLLVHYTSRFSAHGQDERGNSHHMENYNCAIGSLAGKIVRHAVPILLVCALLGVVGFQMDNEIPVNTDENTFVPKDMPAKVDLDKVRRTMGSTSSLPIYVQSENVLSPETLEWMETFQQYEMTRNEKITGSTSIATLIRMYNGGVIPQTSQDIIAATMNIPEDTRKRYLNGKTEAVMDFTTVKMDSEISMSNVDLIKRNLVEVSPPPGVTATVTGTMELFGNLIKEIEKGKIQMTLLAFVLIFGLLCLIYRNPVRALMPLVPIVMLVGWIGLIMYALKIDYTPMTATLGSLAIGVASEYTIVMMERCNEERDGGLPLLGAICHSTKQIGTAITVSGIATVCGFAALIFSNFNLISNFGVVTVITVSFSLLGAIIVMPATMILLGRWDKGKDHPQSEVTPA